MTALGAPRGSHTGSTRGWSDRRSPPALYREYLGAAQHAQAGREGGVYPLHDLSLWPDHWLRIATQGPLVGIPEFMSRDEAGGQRRFGHPWQMTTLDLKHRPRPELYLLETWAWWTDYAVGTAARRRTFLFDWGLLQAALEDFGGEDGA